MAERFHVPAFEPTDPIRSWPEVLAKYNATKPASEPVLTRQTAMRIHDEVLFKLKLELR